MYKRSLTMLNNAHLYKINKIREKTLINAIDNLYLTIVRNFICWKSASTLPKLTEKRTSTSIPINKNCHNKNQS